VTRRHGLAGAFAVWAVALAAAGAGGCGGKYDSSEEPFLILPDEAQFTQQNGVSDFLTLRCAALDCHGQIGRPLRLYSANGLRFADGPGGARVVGGTSPDEKKQNYLAVIGLEPEGLTQVAVTEGEFNDLLLFKKPLDTEGGGVRHKGGPVIRFQDDGWDCLTSWAAGRDKFRAQSCVDAINKP
jgi:hypothetical protein